MSVFSITYDARKQIMFEEALKEKDSTKAKQILESFPKGQNNSEKIEYLIVLNEDSPGVSDEPFNEIPLQPFPAIVLFSIRFFCALNKWIPLLLFPSGNVPFEFVPILLLRIILLSDNDIAIPWEVFPEITFPSIRFFP